MTEFTSVEVLTHIHELSGGKWFSIYSSGITVWNAASTIIAVSLTAAYTTSPTVVSSLGRALEGRPKDLGQ